MITKEILESISTGNRLTDEELENAIEHYKVLESHLKDHLVHSEKYRLVWYDVFFTLKRLEEYSKSRKNKQYV